MDRVNQGFLLMKVHITDVMSTNHLLRTEEALQTIFILISFTKHIHHEEGRVADLSICPNTQKMYSTKITAGIILSKCKGGTLLMTTELDEWEKEGSRLRGR